MLERAAFPLTAFESDVASRKPLEYFRRPFTHLAAVDNGRVVAQREANPSSFLPFTPLDYVDPISKYLDGVQVMPLQLSVTMSERCNFKCQTCFSREDRQNNPLNDISVETYLEMLSYIISFGNPLCQHISSGGSGEAILHKDFVRIMDFAGANGILTYLTTNGSRKDVPFLESLARNASVVTFSILGMHPEVFADLCKPPANVTLEGIMRSIEEIIELRDKYGRYRDLLIGVLSLAHPKNSGHYAEFVEKLVSLGVDYVNINPVLPNLSAHGLSFSREEEDASERALSELKQRFAGSKTLIRTPGCLYLVNDTFYFDPSSRLNKDACMIALFQPNINPVTSDPALAKLTACYDYPAVTDNPEYWYTAKLGPESFKSAWTRENIGRIQKRTEGCKACVRGRQLMTLDWMLHYKKTLPSVEFYLMFPENGSESVVDFSLVG